MRATGPTREGIRPLAIRAAITSTLLAVLLPQCSAPRAVPDMESASAPKASDGGLLNTPTPTGDVGDELLLYEIKLPENALPNWDRVTVSLTHFTVRPGTETEWKASSGACCPGPKIKFILEGSLTVVSEGPAQLIRTGASVETIPAGTEMMLGPGDTLITRNEIGDIWANAGPEAVELLSTPVLSGFSPGPPVPPGWLGPQESDLREGISLPAGAYTLRLRRVTLRTDVVLAPPPGGRQLAIILGDAAIVLTRTADDTVTARGEPDGSAVAYVLTVDRGNAGR